MLTLLESVALTGEAVDECRETILDRPTTDESLHPDLEHGGSIGPHYDYKSPGGPTYRVYPDGRVIPK
ncbi:MAG: hypothetical protein QOG70_1182 [Solirubrobacteraceae bacterium]|jgi:hypothetical protein|nr:hypothetical protein [Solirubrobacteraceae bacterium]